MKKVAGGCLLECEKQVESFGCNLKKINQMTKIQVKSHSPLENFLGINLRRYWN